MRQKKILIIGHAPLPKAHPDYKSIDRHPGRWVYDQAKALSENSEYAVTLVTLVKGAGDDFEISDSALRVIYLKAQPRARVWSLFIWDVRLLKALIKKEEPDLVHAHGIEDAYALAICKRKTAKVLTLQSLYEDYNAKNPVSWYSAPKLIERLEKKAIRGFGSVIVKSAQFAEVVKTYHPILKYKIIPNTLSEIFVNAPEEKKQINKVAFVGTICPRKGFHIIRKALEAINHQECLIELHIYGEGGDLDYVNKELAAVAATGHQLVNHGSVTAIELMEELITVNMLLAPSYAETYGNQVIEALLCRCHCVVSENTGMSENIRKYGHGTIIPQRASSELANSIMSQVSIAASEAEIASRGSARTRLLRDLGPSVISKKLSEVYAATLA